IDAHHLLADADGVHLVENDADRFAFVVDGNEDGEHQRRRVERGAGAHTRGLLRHLRTGEVSGAVAAPDACAGTLRANTTAPAESEATGVSVAPRDLSH